jgi:hypothetical protein
MSKTPSLNFCESTIELVQNIEGAFIELGKRLLRIRDERLWESNWESYEEFLSEIKISPGKASKICSVYEKFVVEYGVEQEKLAGVGWSNLYSMLPAIKSKRDATEWVDKGMVLRREDIEDEVREFKHGKCDHKNFRELHIYICNDCGKKWSAGGQ